MDRQTMIDLAQRIARAPHNEARLHELMNFAPDATLARLGLAHRSSVLGPILALTGAVAIGAVVGAGVALLLAPMAGKELQAKLRGRAERMSREPKKAAPTDHAPPSKHDQGGVAGNGDSAASNKHGTANA